VIDLLVTSRRGALSTQVLGELYVALVSKKIAPPSDAELAVNEYARIWPVLEIRLPFVLEAARAARRYQQNYYDALIWATAKLHGLPSLLSEDGQDGQVIEGVRRVNPLLETFDLSLLA
jgi:predicted nucleic acid-binding protein